MGLCIASQVRCLQNKYNLKLWDPIIFSLLFQKLMPMNSPQRSLFFTYIQGYLYISTQKVYVNVVNFCGKYKKIMVTLLFLFWFCLFVVVVIVLKRVIYFCS